MQPERKTFYHTCTLLSWYGQVEKLKTACDSFWISVFILKKSEKLQIELSHRIMIETVRETVRLKAYNSYFYKMKKYLPYLNPL